jgi:exodeoxyribonuclease VII large subunit
MSKDQLSWEQLLNPNAATTPGSAAENPTESQAATSAEATADTGGVGGTEASAPETTAKPRKSRKTKVEAKVVTTESTELYSKKDWSKLDLTVKKEPGASPDVVEAKVTEGTATLNKQTGQLTSQESVVKKASTVSIPVVRSPAQLPYEAEELLNELDREEDAQESKEPKVLSVSDLNRYIKELLEGQFATIWLKAEISNFKAHTSGHFYFSLKDSRAQISAVMFRGYNGQLRFRPEDGMEVLVRGKITVYEPRGNYQIFCEMMEPVGAGALQKAFEQLKAKLQKEGLFDEARKRPLPALPRHIAIVTSPTGAAIRDMLNVLGRRFKGAHVTVIPCKVQGDAAPGEIVEAIKLAQKLKDVDVMIVGRGGGSIEDLWAFNDERVARAIAAARVPVISAVGHEIDFTIADFVADLRAPTPSAAAELVVRNAADLVDRLRGYQRALTLALAQRMNFSREQLGYFSALSSAQFVQSTTARNKFQFCR